MARMNEERLIRDDYSKFANSVLRVIARARGGLVPSTSTSVAIMAKPMRSSISVSPDDAQGMFDRGEVFDVAVMDKLVMAAAIDVARATAELGFDDRLRIGGPWVLSKSMSGPIGAVTFTWTIDYSIDVG